MDEEEFAKEMEESGYVLDDSGHYYEDREEYKKWHPGVGEVSE